MNHRDSSLSIFHPPAQGARAFQPLRLVSATLCLVMCLVLGCASSRTGVLSQNDYSYEVATPEQMAEVRARFDRVLGLLETEGFKLIAMNPSEKRSEALLKAEGTEAKVVLNVPDNGFATIAFTYVYEGTGEASKAEAEALVARVEMLLAPAQH